MDPHDEARKCMKGLGIAIWFVIGLATGISGWEEFDNKLIGAILFAVINGPLAVWMIHHGRIRNKDILERRTKR